MPGCLSYVVANDSVEPHVLWVTEVWDRAESHDASVSLPAVKAATPIGKALIDKFERIAVTTPVWSVAINSE
jgi:quinol monooxygenase YgiN